MKGRIRCAGVVEFGGLVSLQRALLRMLKKRVEDLFNDLSFERFDEWLGHRPA